MDSLGQARNFGVIGSILILLPSIPFLINVFLSLFRYAGMVIYLVGLTFILIAVKYISETLEDKYLFNNMLIFVILAAISVVLASFEMLFRSLFGHETASVLSGISYIVFAISAIFLKRSYNTIAAKLKINKFNTAALLILIAALLSIAYIILISFSVFLGEAVLLFIALASYLQQIIIFIANILQGVAFNSIKETSQSSQK